MMRNKSSFLYLAGLALFVGFIGLGGCTHGSDDTGGNSSMGSMSGTTDRQFTQSNANQAGPVGGATRSSSAGSGSATGTDAASTGGSGTSGASMGTAGNAGSAESTPPGGSK